MIITDTDLAILIFKNGAWGPGGSRAKVESFLDEAYAVMMAESGGNTNAKNANSSASGLFQIMVSAHTAEIQAAVKKLSPAGKTLDIFDPDVNVEVARKVWNSAGQSWSPWEAYTKKTEAYRKNKGHGKAMYTYLDTMTQAQMGEAYSKIAGMVNPAFVVASNFKDDPWGSMANFAKEAGVTIGVFVAGLIAIILGLWYLLNSTKMGKQATSAATMVATKGLVK